MTIYILPDKIEDFKKKLNRMMAHLENKPSVTYSEPQEHKVTDIVSYNKGWDGRERYQYMLTLIEVSIEDVCQCDWLMVASVFHDEGVVEMIDKQMFKSIPQYMGLKYYRCDYCGRKEARRKTSHIIYNKVTGEWKQVGSSCVNKMFDNGKYLADFSIKLFNLIEVCFGGCSLDMFGFGGRIPDHYYKQALSLEEMIYCTSDFMDAGNIRWEKALYERVGGRSVKVKDSTTTTLNEYHDTWTKKGTYKGLYKAVSEFVKGLDNSSDFIANIKRAFEAEFIARHEVFVAFYALKMYKDSLNPFDQKCEEFGIKENEKFHIEGSITSKKVHTDEWGLFYEYIILDSKTGLEFIKTSSSNVLFDKYTDANGKISFSSMIGRIDNKDYRIRLNGRLSK
jgi:hypothetical protein